MTRPAATIKLRPRCRDVARGGDLFVDWIGLVVPILCILTARDADARGAVSTLVGLERCHIR